MTKSALLPETDSRKLIDLHLNCGIPDPAVVIPNIPERLRRFIFKACQPNPDQRYQTINEALGDLTRLADELGIIRRQSEKEKINMTSLCIVYSENKQPAVEKLMKTLRAQAKEFGIELKAADFKEI